MCLPFSLGLVPPFPTFLPSHSQPRSAARLSGSSHSVWKFVFPRMNPLVRPPARSTAPKTPPPGAAHSGVEREREREGFRRPPGVSVPSGERAMLGRRRIGPVTNQGERRRRSKRFRKSLSFQHHKLFLPDRRKGRTTPHNSPSPPPSRPLSSLTPSSLPPSLPSPSPCPATSTYFTDVMVTYVALRGATLDDDERARAARVKFTFGHEGEGWREGGRAAQD